MSLLTIVICAFIGLIGLHLFLLVLARVIEALRRWSKLYYFSNFASKRITEDHFEFLGEIKERARLLRRDLAECTFRPKQYHDQFLVLARQLDELRQESPLSLDAMAFTLYHLFAKHIVQLLTHCDAPPELVTIAGCMAYTKLDEVTADLPASSKTIRSLLFTMLKGTSNPDRRANLLHVYAHATSSIEVERGINPKDAAGNETGKVDPYDAILLIAVAYLREEVLFSTEKGKDLPLFSWIRSSPDLLRQLFFSNDQGDEHPGVIATLVLKDAISLARTKGYRSRFEPARNWD